MCAFFVGILKM